MDPQEEDNTDAASSTLIHGLSCSRHGDDVASNDEFGDGHDDASYQLSDADDDPSVVVTLVRNTTKKSTGGGRSIHLCWELLSDETGQHLVSQSKCRSCMMIVKHHRKSEKVKAHLNSCREFHRKMADLPSIDVPSWVTIQGRAAAAKSSTKRKWTNPAPQTAPPADTLYDVASTQASNSSTIASSPFPMRSLTKIPTAAAASIVATTQKSKQRTMRDFVIPQMSPTDHAAFQSNLAMHIYMTGTSFVRVEEQHLLLALQKLRPDVRLPSRRDLSGRLLNGAHSQVKEKVDAWLARDLFACITSDAWSNIKNESVINYMLVSGDISLFLESNSTGEDSHTSEFLANDLSRVIKATSGKIAGAIMDNTSANKRAWTLLKAFHPDKFFQGCVAHGLHLLVKDIFAATKTKRNHIEARYPDLYPFEYLLTFTMECKKVVKFFHNHLAPKHQLKLALRKAGLKMLVQMAPTRWGSLINMTKTLLAAEEVLLQLVSSRDFVRGTAAQKAERQDILNTIGNPTFVPYLSKMIEMLSPIDSAIVYYQSDSVPISEVYRTFSSKLPLSIHAMTLINGPERQYMLNLITKRMSFMYGDAHGIAYVLDPRYLGMDMSPDQRIEVEDMIYSHPTLGPSTAESQEAMVVEYTNFRIAALEMRRCASLMFRMLLSRKISVLMFWMSHGDAWPTLQVLARQVLSLVASSAASERNFSTFGFIHSKQRNCLSEASVEKLVYVKNKQPTIYEAAGCGCSV
ncbi:transposase [Fragilaria crotonensis]|nr:transposase [Fragilaria crotonensis]